jgi:hypothetical protein
MIIGISGRIAAGKDTLAQFIREIDPQWEIKKFAAKLKQVASILTGVSTEKFEDQEFKKQYMAPEWGMMYREFLQKLGTDAIRKGLHDNAWVNALMSDYKLMRYLVDDIPTGEYPKWLITDVRFPNEAAAVKNAGGTMIRIWREPEIPGDSSLHISETALDGYPFDFRVANTGTLDELRVTASMLISRL